MLDCPDRQECGDERFSGGLAKGKLWLLSLGIPSRHSAICGFEAVESKDAVEKIHSVRGPDRAGSCVPSRCSKSLHAPYAKGHSRNQHFAEVTPDLYWGAVPRNARAFRELAARGLKIDVELETGGKQSRREARWASSAGTRYVHLS